VGSLKPKAHPLGPPRALRHAVPFTGHSRRACDRGERSSMLHGRVRHERDAIDEVRACVTASWDTMLP
jgi:hypothetical protein